MSQVVDRFPSGNVTDVFAPRTCSGEFKVHLERVETAHTGLLPTAASAIAKRPTNEARGKGRQNLARAARATDHRADRQLLQRRRTFAPRPAVVGSDRKTAGCSNATHSAPFSNALLSTALTQPFVTRKIRAVRTAYPLSTPAHAEKNTPRRKAEGVRAIS